MTLAGIYSGMNLVVRRQDSADPGQIVLASVPYQGTVVRTAGDRSHYFRKRVLDAAEVRELAG